MKSKYYYNLNYNIFHFFVLNKTGFIYLIIIITKILHLIITLMINIITIIITIIITLLITIIYIN